jgi:hypothetical protein
VTRADRRKSGMRKIAGLILAVAMLAALATTAQAQLSSGHRIARTTAPDYYVRINVTLSDSRITLSRYSAPRGADAKFYVRNVGTQVHSFQLGKAKAGLGFQDGFHVDLKPGQQKLLILFLDYRTKVPYFSPQKADLNNPHMKGFFTIGPCAPVEIGNVDGC